MQSHIDPLSNMPVEIQDVLRRLEFFAQQERGVKPCVKQRIFVDANSWTGTFYRTFHGETSAGTIADIKSMLKEFGVYVTRYPSYRPLLDEALTRARKGIATLFETYQHKPAVMADLRVIMAMIDIFLTPDSSMPVPVQFGARDHGYSSSAPHASEYLEGVEDHLNE